MPDMNPKKTPMPEQEPDVRNKNFDEVALGYTEEMACKEAARCLHCKNQPCVKGCPVGVHIPDFIRSIAQGDMESAYRTIKLTNSLPAVCGRVCPQENQCEHNCVRGIKGEPVGIGRLERFAADWHMKHGKDEPFHAEPNGHKVAVVGAGPAGLTCAGDLAAMGYSVTVFEALHTAGGVLMYGIPQFRLPKEIVQKEIDGLRQKGVKIETDMVIGKLFSVDELFQNGFEAVFIGTGAGLPRFMNIPGEGLVGVYSANEFLTRVNLMKAYKPEYDTPILKVKNVAVVGGGNVAMDAARTALRLGSEKVYIIYRRAEEQMPARREEVHHAKEEGVEFHLLCNPVAIKGDETGRVASIECIRMELGEADASGRRKPIPVEDSNFSIPVDCVVMAIGNSPNPLIRTTTKGLEANNRGCIVVKDESMATSREGVYAAGDAVSGAATVILAMGGGKDAARSIDQYIQSKAK
ncbi:MAG: NADPH-dependent glutamate synthase [Oscillospiraceae bacterium]|jgi:glutamate synthase (NADPH/NADH) small chain|nr:NADPH-dependent glutamate synthase [Oscillospiraceae bacterium]